MLSVPVVLSLLLAGCASPESGGLTPSGSDYLFVWSGDADEEESDFLAVIDANPSSATYTEVVATVPVGVSATMPHHTEYEYPDDDMLFANGWKAGNTFVFNLTDPLHPSVAADFMEVDGYAFPHSFERLPNGHVLATFQARGTHYAPVGGLVEMDNSGNGIRSGSAVTEGIPEELNWPYSLIVLPDLHLAVATSSDMGIPPWDEYVYHETSHVQVWSLEDLSIAATVVLPEVAAGAYHLYPAEPRRLEDGTVYVNTFNCGLYRMDGLAGDAPSAVFVHGFPLNPAMETSCAVPVVMGTYWIQTVPALPGLIVLDVADSSAPVEAYRFPMDSADYPMPHWVAADRSSNRVVVTGDGASWVLILRFDPETGELSMDESFTEKGADRAGLDFSRSDWPHGNTGGAVVHGALFSN